MPNTLKVLSKETSVDPWCGSFGAAASFAVDLQTLVNVTQHFQD